MHGGTDVQKKQFLVHGGTDVQIWVHRLEVELPNEAEAHGLKEKGSSCGTRRRQKDVWKWAGEGRGFVRVTYAEDCKEGGLRIQPSTSTQLN